MYCLVRIENKRMHPSEIPKETYDILKNGYLEMQEVIFVFEKFNQYKSALIELEKWTHSVKTDSSMIMKNQEDAERLCQSVLTAFKNYLTHLKTHIEDKYGEKSPLDNLYENSRKNARESSIEFSFAYELRNYAQHEGSIVHSVMSNNSCLKPASDPHILLSHYPRWNRKEKEFISSHSGGIDLQDIFEKAYNSLGLIHQPIVQYLLDNSNAASNFFMFRTWMDKRFSREDAKLYNLTVVERADGSAATMEDYKKSVPGLKFTATAIDWEMIYEITDALLPRRGPRKKVPDRAS